MKLIKKLKKDDLGAGILSVVVLILLTLMGFSYAYQSEGSVAYRDLAIFVVLFIIVFFFLLVVRSIINIDSEEEMKEEAEEEKEEKREEEKKKGLVARIINKENIFFNNFIRASFHLLPLYFTLILIKIDLWIGFKAVLFVFSIVAYMMIEINYIYRKIFKFADKYAKNKKYEVYVLIVTPIMVLAATVYFAYNLVLFYMNRFK